MINANTVCVDTAPPKRRADFARRASVALSGVLLMLSAFALLGAYSTFKFGTSARYATAVSSAFEEARYFVGAEESLERKYRLEPSPEVHSLHRQAGVSLLAALARVRTLGSDAVLIDKIGDEHTQYLRSIDRMFAAIDAHDVNLANSIDEEEVDPSFDAIETQVLSAAAARQADATRHLKQLAQVQKALLIGTPIVFFPGTLLVGYFWTMLRRLRREAEQGERRFKSLVQNASDLILICTSSGQITYQSPAAEIAWGYSSTRLLNDSLKAFIHPQDESAFSTLWVELLNSPGTAKNAEFKMLRADGQWRHVSLIVSNLLLDQSVAGIVATARDVTERKRFEEQLTTQAFYDSLTELPNRVLFRDRLNQALTRAERHSTSVALLYIDVDNFKQINDSLGHEMGDTLLVDFARRLRACVPSVSTVARLGGDEFVVLVERVFGEADAVLLSQHIAESLRQPFRLADRDFTISASIGIALGNAEAADTMLRDADVAMYRAKGAGKGGHVVFDPAMHVDALLRLETENDLRRAITQGELRVQYQPIVSLDGGHVAEVEALVRWQHPTRGLLAPAEFIRIAEETGLIVPLGQWVLEQACRQVAEWQNRWPTSPPLTVSVNLSPVQFQQSNLLDGIKRALSEAGLPATRLKLEVTESVIMRDIETTIATLWQLKDLGIQLAIDDFGTGYSSLAYLKRLPFDVLKIDRSFVTGIGRDQGDTVIVQAVIALAKSLNLAITAEGVETADQSALLQEWACDRAQGYYFSRPLDASRMTDLLGADSGGNCQAEAA